ncbi:MAG: hypothetical protein ACPGU7_01130 [Gammaproteobacteria bacterium]
MSEFPRPTEAKTTACTPVPSDAQLELFSSARFERGPHPIPRKRQVAHRFHRIFSIKAGFRDVVAESDLEADVIYWAEGSANVVGLCEQPIRIHQSIGHRPYLTLDLSLRYSDSTEIFYEIKPEQRLRDYANGRRLPESWPYIEAWSSKAGFHCDYITDKDIAGDALTINNWRRLLPFARNGYQYADQVMEDIIENLCLESSVPVRDVLRHFGTYKEQATVSAIAKLLHLGRLVAPLEKEIFSADTILRTGEAHEAG